LGSLAAAGTRSSEGPNEDGESDEVLGARPGRRGSVLGPSCTDRRGAGEKDRLGDAAGVDWLDWPEKRSNHIPRPHHITSGCEPEKAVARVDVMAGSELYM